MSSTRATVWSAGLLIVAGLLWAWRGEADFAGLRIPLALLGLALTALVSEALSLRLQTPAVPLRDSRPADGIVEVVTIVGVDGEPNGEWPRFRRFVGLQGGVAASPPIRTLPRGRPELLGQIVLVAVFIGRDGVGWSDEEIARGHEALERAGLWIEREASRRGAPVNIGLAETYFRAQDDEVDAVEVAFASEGEDVGPMEAHASTKAFVALSRAAGSLGFADAVDLVGRINRRIEADAVVWLLHLRRSGRSLAIPAGESEIDGAGLAVCFAREASFPEPLRGPGRVDPTTVVHELLHLFGASDKYGRPIASFPPSSVSSKDIMRLDHDHLSRMRIDGLTAAEIGWRSESESNGSRKKARRPPG